MKIKLHSQNPNTMQSTVISVRRASISTYTRISKEKKLQKRGKESIKLKNKKEDYSFDIVIP